MGIGECFSLDISVFYSIPNDIFTSDYFDCSKFENRTKLRNGFFWSEMSCQNCYLGFNPCSTRAVKKILTRPFEFWTLSEIKNSAQRKVKREDWTGRKREKVGQLSPSTETGAIPGWAMVDSTHLIKQSMTGSSRQAVVVPKNVPETSHSNVRHRSFNYGRLLIEEASVLTHVSLFWRRRFTKTARKSLKMSLLDLCRSRAISDLSLKKIPSITGVWLFPFPLPLQRQTDHIFKPFIPICFQNWEKARKAWNYWLGRKWSMLEGLPSGSFQNLNISLAARFDWNGLDFYSEYLIIIGSQVD